MKKQTFQRTSFLHLLILWIPSGLFVHTEEVDVVGYKKFGDKCRFNNECGFDGAICDEVMLKCICKPELPITNHLDRCGVAVRINESCIFNEQCENLNRQTECKEGICSCRYGMQTLIKSDGQVDCVTDIKAPYTPEKYVDPAMIGILVVMFLMFITICIVLRLFSKARWRENRTIFNTPNPRLMNVSIFKENKHLHDRRGSKTSRGPSRQPSLSSLRTHSPNSQGSRRGSRESSNSSAVSTKANKSPSQTPKLENVTVEIQQPKE